MASYTWPDPSSSANPSVGPGGQIAPTSATLVAGINPSGNLTPFTTDAGSALIVSPLSSSSVVTVVQPDGTLLHATIDASALPTGAATSSLQTTGNSVLGSILLDLTNGTQITQVSNFPATQPISGTVTANQGTANATPWNENIAQINGSTVLVGHGTAAGTLRVELPTDGTGVVGLNAGTQSIGSIINVSGTISLPTGASTSALQTTGNTSLATIATNQTSGGQKTQISTPTALTVTQAAIAVGTTAVRLTVSGSAPASTRVVLVATPDSVSTAVFYIGSSSVTSTSTTRGIEITAGQSFIANNDAGDYWIVSNTAAQTVTVMEQA